ncbi:MAG TPA: hypothetical protein VGL58_04065 [Caulobacteraceae bacterium]|jgi:hypothetical protein
MDQSQVHYELFVRQTPGAPWKLEMAGESRAQVVESAEALMTEGKVAAVRVTKETLDPDTREFMSVAILSKGKVDAGKKKKVVEDHEPLCVSPQDLYSLHARDRIGRLLEGWLTRNRATPFELLHRPDLVEILDAAGNELQHAVQKIAVPEAQSRGISVHELIRSFQKLIERAIGRVLTDGRKGRFPNLATESFAEAAARVAGDPEAAYLLGGAIAGHLAPAQTWSGKVSLLLDLADAAPEEGLARQIAFQVLEQPLSEILESRAGFAELLGGTPDLGGQLAAMTWLAARDAVTSLVAHEPGVAKSLPPLEGAAARLAGWLAKPPFADTRGAVGRRVLRELLGPRRLRPTSARDEIELLRGLGMALTAASGQLLPLDNVQEAFNARSRMLVTADFVESLLGRENPAREEAELLIRLCENVIGPANKRQAARYLVAHVGSLRFEKEMRGGPDTAAQRLALMAQLQRAAGRVGLDEADLRPIQQKVGDIGGMVEADAKLTVALLQAQAPVFHRLSLLLKLAVGEAAPLGPAADRARGAAFKLLRSDTARAELAAAPEQLLQVREMIQAAGLAA